MSYSYEYDEATRTGTVLLDGVPQFAVDAEINPTMCGWLGTPKWAIQLADGRAVVDAATRTITFAADHGQPQRSFKAKPDTDRPEILAGVNAVKALFPGRDDAWAKAYLKFHRQFDLFISG